MAIQLLRDYVQSGQLDGFDQPGPNHRFFEEGMQSRYIIPGHFYTFAQMNPRGNDQLPSLDDWTAGIAKSKPYFDNAPIFLALDQYGLGLNVKLIPQLARRFFLRSYIRTVMPVLEKLVDDAGNFLEFTIRSQPPRLNPFATVNRNWIRERLFSSVPEIKFDFLVDKYKRDEMRYLTMIDWPHVPKVGEVNYSNDQTIVSRSAISDYLKNV
jgi:hypothetical protein